MRADHPRIRGEHVLRNNIFESQGGSSPHTRGAPERAGGPPAAQRIIPAYAGSTGRGPRTPHTCKDHPRIRGEHQLAGQQVVPGVWIIPAYAGSTRLRGIPISSLRDHPRIRGEHRRAATPAPLTPGSSPHTRGARPRPGPAKARRGIIPAYAGSTARPGSAGRRWSDHPRIRGEHRDGNLLDEHPAGSSPHTRGAPWSGSGGWGRAGIIPAYAGSTRPGSGRTVGPWDHPRIRGEHSNGPNSTRPVAGSSPHTRGALGFVPGPGSRRGIIPAYAGSTPPSSL